MRPAFLDNMSWAMAEVYGAVTDRLLINLAKYFPYIKSSKELKATFDYQARLLAQMGQVTRESAQIIADSLGGADAALRQALEAAILDALKNEEPALRKAAQKGLLNGAGVLPPEVTANQMQAFEAYYKQSADKLNLVNTVMLESTEDAYRATVSDIAARIGRTQSILNTSTGEVVTGVSSWNTAMHDAVQQMLKNGLTGFVDHAGRRWSPEAYVAMDIRTTMFNVSRAAVWERADSYGADLYQVSSHNGARPLCYPWQGKVISRSGWSGEVEDLYKNKVRVYAQSATSYGQAAGLFGVNCRHYPMTFIPGFSTLKGEPQDPEENDELYALTQQQRGMERKLREQKRDLAVMKAQGADKEAIDRQRVKVDSAQSALESFCDEHGLPRRRNREYTPINATWPAEGTYDPALFRTEQRDRMAAFFGSGQNVASQATPAQPSRDIFKNTKGIDQAFQQGMADVLNNSPSTAAKMIYTKYADELECTDPKGKKGAYFSAKKGGVSMNVAEVAKGNGYEEPYQVAFHEFGHMIDWLAGGKDKWTYLSNKPFNGQQLLAVIKSDFQTFKKAQGVSKAVDVIPILKAENMDIKTRGNISDILEKCTGKSYPLDVGHGAAYHKNNGATEKEFFAEVLDSAVANRPAYDQMVRLFPNAVDLVWDMVRSVIG